MIPLPRSIQPVEFACTSFPPAAVSSHAATPAHRSIPLHSPYLCILYYYPPESMRFAMILSSRLFVFIRGSLIFLVAATLLQALRGSSVLDPHLGTFPHPPFSLSHILPFPRLTLRVLRILRGSYIFLWLRLRCSKPFVVH